MNTVVISFLKKMCYKVPKKNYFFSKFTCYLSLFVIAQLVNITMDSWI